MSRFHSHINSATKIINTYGAGKPLANHIRNYFSNEKKFGSRDRRSISNLCYCYFRTGKAFMEKSIEEKILAGLFLCENVSNELLHFFRPDLNEQISLSTQEKLALLAVDSSDIFPFANELGENVQPAAFTNSFFKQPAVFLRIRPGKKSTVLQKLSEGNVPFELHGENCVRMNGHVAVDKLLRLNKDAVVQDMNSQKVFDFLDAVQAGLPEVKPTAWDCCAASGGKSILLFDKLSGNVKLTVSDIRETILVNLRTRLQQAGLNIQRDFLADLSVSAGLPPEEKFSIIICDVPCTGSGTWGRNPEQLFSFEKNSIQQYASRQKKIVSNTMGQLKPGGLFFYITCSVFKIENEDMVHFTRQKFSFLELLDMKYLPGYEDAADTMFVAVFRRPNA